MTKLTLLLEIIANVVEMSAYQLSTVHQIYQHQNVVQIQLLLVCKIFYLMKKYGSCL